MSASVTEVESPAVGDGVVPAERVPAPSRTRGEWTYHATFLGLSLVVIGLSFALACHDNNRQVVVPLLGAPLPELCSAKRMGFECPGCGLTRSFISLAHGELARAWAFNPGGILLFALVVAQVPYRAWQLWRLARGRTAFGDWRLMIPLYVCAAALLVQWAVRLAWTALQ